VALLACREGAHALPLMSRRTPVFRRSAGEPVAETLVLLQRETFRGVCTFFTTPDEDLKELIDETLEMLTASAVTICDIDKWFPAVLSTEDAVLVEKCLSSLPLEL
jgi:hypothetical protein